jgi:hypothetical protein
MRLYEFQDHKLKKINDFAEWAMSKLAIENKPKFNYSNDKSIVDKNSSFGSTKPSGEIWVYIGDRNTADALRTLCHELVHHRQFEKGIQIPDNQEDRFKLEDQANAIAGRMMRAYALKHQDIFEAKTQPADELGALLADSLPQAFVIPALNSSNPYEQYKFGVAIARARGMKDRVAQDIPEPPDLDDVWGQNEVVVGFDPHLEDVINFALKATGTPGGMRRIGTKGSKENPKVHTQSPVRKFKGF